MVSHMEDGFRLQDSRVAIVGLGLMGGSLALALKGRCAALYGVDSDPGTLALARERCVVERVENDPSELLPEADVIILATPVQVILGMIERLPSLTRKPCILFDLGSTKTIITQAMFTLPEYFDPIGGHPICGKEKLGLRNADAELFRAAPFVITPLERTTARARSLILEVIEVIGARPVQMSAATHDHALAFTSHLPFLLATALVGSLTPESKAVIGPGFRSTSRLAGTSSHMMMGVLESNRASVLLALQEFQRQLAMIEAELSSNDDTALQGTLDSARAHYLSIMG
jgi:prephenate dehydrogenase